MTYWNLESAARNNPKLVAAGKDAVCLWVMCALYSAEQLTDGLVPQAEVDRIIAEWGLAPGTVAKCLEALVPGRRPLLDSDPAGVRVHDWQDYNPEAARIKRLSADRKRAGRKGAESRYSSKCQEQVLEASADSNGLVGRLVGRLDPDPEGGAGGATPSPTVSASAVELAYRKAYEARNPRAGMARPAPGAAARVASWATQAGIPEADVLAALPALVDRAKGLGLLPSVWDELHAAPATNRSQADSAPVFRTPNVDMRRLGY